ncbi:MAG: dienelactone hydrolase family protein [Chloroflexi bacterium]|nr:dienelactone hydrolase family protein [Chloroflexota bacterium]
MSEFVHVHTKQPVLAVGKSPDAARAVVILLHGRGSNARSILGLVPEIEHPDCAFIAPQASGYTWYPYPFIEPIEKNEPHLSSALKIVHEQIERLEESGIPSERILLLGFSQGACLALESAARRGGRLGGVAGLSGGLIGQTLDRSRYAETMDGTPVFFGCSDTDSHIPRNRVEESAGVFQELGATVTMRLYPRMGHTINEDEITMVRSMIAHIAGEH